MTTQMTVTILTTAATVLTVYGVLHGLRRAHEEAEGARVRVSRLRELAKLRGEEVATAGNDADSINGITEKYRQMHVAEGLPHTTFETFDPSGTTVEAALLTKVLVGVRSDALLVVIGAGLGAAADLVSTWAPSA